MIQEGLKTSNYREVTKWNEVTQGGIDAQLLIVGSSRALVHFDLIEKEKASGKLSVFVKNDFEKAVGMAHPTVAEIVHYAYTNQAVYAAMSGSGSTCFALFEGHQTLPDFSPFSHCWIRKIKLS